LLPLPEQLAYQPVFTVLTFEIILFPKDYWKRLYGLESRELLNQFIEKKRDRRKLMGKK
jgi:hypothetical protein